MPLYEYKCHRCGRNLEVQQKFADEPLTIHEGCGGELERLISVPTLQFKGSGWYVTDYPRNGSSTNGSRSSSSQETKAEAKPETKPVSTPETKPAPTHAER
jgi:putative FmdB family regulatory protein